MEIPLELGNTEVAFENTSFKGDSEEPTQSITERLIMTVMTMIQ